MYLWCSVLLIIRPYPQPQTHVHLWGTCSQTLLERILLPGDCPELTARHSINCTAASASCTLSTGVVMVAVSGGIRHGDQPMHNWKGENLVLTLTVLMIAKCTHSSAFTHPFWFHCMWQCSNILFEHSLEPSISGWSSASPLWGYPAPSRTCSQIICHECWQYSAGACFHSNKYWRTGQKIVLQIHMSRHVGAIMDVCSNQ